MNCNIYILGNCDTLHLQYPKDCSEVFQEAYKISDSLRQLIYFRSGSIMYHVFYKKIDEINTIGFCVETNGVVFLETEILFSLFEEALEQLIFYGKILNINEKGKVVVSENVGNAFLDHVHYEKISSFILSELEHKKSSFEKLPLVNFSKEIGTKRCFNEGNFSKYPFVTAFQDCTIVSVSKNSGPSKKNFVNEIVNLIQTKSSENKKVNDNLEELKKEYDKLNREKKRTTVVSLLIIFSMILGFSIFGLLRSSKRLEMNIKSLETKNENLSTRILSLNNSISNLSAEKESLLTEKAESKKLISNYQRNYIEKKFYQVVKEDNERLKKQDEQNGVTIAALRREISSLKMSGKSQNNKIGSYLLQLEVMSGAVLSPYKGKYYLSKRTPYRLVLKVDGKVKESYVLEAK